MKIQEFIDEVVGDLATFQRYWNEKKEAKPNDFPSELEPQEWHEQFQCWCELEATFGRDDADE